MPPPVDWSGKSGVGVQVDSVFALTGLFGIAFAAATLLPAQSEATLVGLQMAGYPVVLLVVVASIGNTLGAVMT